jgi:DNA-binding transcriptional ArsR family regulator
VSPRKCPVPTHPPMTAPMLDAVAAQFRALAEPTRLQLLQILRTGPHSVTDLAAKAGLSHANASKHLLVLAAAGFASRTEEGTKAVYALADETTHALCTIMCDRVARQAEDEARMLRRR